MACKNRGANDWPLEKEIIIELPIPKNQWQQMGLLEVMERDVEEAKLRKTARIYRILLEKLKETRTIKIKGKNVDSLDLEKVAEPDSASQSEKFQD